MPNLTAAAEEAASRAIADDLSAKRTPPSRAGVHDRSLTSLTKQAFKLAGDLETDMQVEGVDADMFWEFVQKSYNVESRKDLTRDQWQGIVARLSTLTDEGGAPNWPTFKPWVDKVRAAMHVDPEPEPPEQDPAVPTLDV